MVIARMYAIKGAGPGRCLAWLTRSQGRTAPAFQISTTTPVRGFPYGVSDGMFSLLEAAPRLYD